MGSPCRASRRRYVGWVLLNPGWGVYAPADAVSAMRDLESEIASELAAGRNGGLRSDAAAPWRIFLNVDLLKSEPGEIYARAYRYDHHVRALGLRVDGQRLTTEMERVHAGAGVDERDDPLVRGLV